MPRLVVCASRPLQHNQHVLAHAYCAPYLFFPAILPPLLCGALLELSSYASQLVTCIPRRYPHSSPILSNMHSNAFSTTSPPHPPSLPPIKPSSHPIRTLFVPYPHPRLAYQPIPFNRQVNTANPDLCCSPSSYRSALRGRPAVAQDSSLRGSERQSYGTPS